MILPGQADVQILRKKKSFPIVYAWENTSENQKKELVQLFLGDPIDEKGKGRVLQILEDAGARSHSQHLIEGFCQAAVREIERLQVSPTARAGFRRTGRVPEPPRFFTTQAFLNLPSGEVQLLVLMSAMQEELTGLEKKRARCRQRPVCKRADFPGPLPG